MNHLRGWNPEAEFWLREVIDRLRILGEQEEWDKKHPPGSPGARTEQPLRKSAGSEGCSNKKNHKRA